MIAAALERGRAPPPALLDEPAVTEAAEPYWVAFFTLTEGRQVSVGMGGAVEQALPYTDISAYARDHGFADDPQDLRDFVRLIRAMDRVWVDEAAKRAAERAKASKRERAA